MTVSPFKFLDSFERGDRSIFFGRDEEIEQLYRLLFEARLVLVYGQSGAGKTSLIRCGLANRFADTDWFELFVRRNDDLNKSLAREIRAKATTPLPDDKAPVDAIRSLYLDHLRPVYLIFDQFEELFILGSKDEQQQFFGTVAAILASDASCKIIVSLREEYLGSLYPFEGVVPALFNKRLRVEQMSMTNIEEVITGMTGALGIKLEHGGDTAQKIISQLDDGRNGVQLAYLQVYLDSLYQRAAPRGEPVTFTDQDVEETGKLGDLMAGYLQTQRTEIENELRTKRPDLPRDSIQHLLEAFVTADGTKQPTTRADVLGRIPESAPWLDEALVALENARILRANEQNIELAHDALAKLIADARSADRLAMLNIERLVRDALFHHQQDSSAYLSSKDLKIIRRAEKLSKAGMASLQLSPDELSFVKRSRRRRLWHRIFIGIGGVFLFFCALYLLAWFSDVDDRKVAYLNTVDFLTESAVKSLSDKPTPELVELKTKLLTREADDNQRAEWLVGDSGAFWQDFLSVELDVAKGHKAAGEAAYDRMEAQLRKTLAADEDGTDIDTRVRLIAVLRRQNDLFQPGDEHTVASYRKMLDTLFDLRESTDEDALKNLDLKPDILVACEYFKDRAAYLAVDGGQSPPIDERCSGS